MMNIVRIEPECSLVERFAAIVESVGGVFENSENHSQWTIGEDSWTAELIIINEQQVIEKNAHPNRKSVVHKNGEELSLSGCWSAAYQYTFSDLEKLLNVSITWENHKATADIAVINHN
jgi:hypothetical protein